MDLNAILNGSASPTTSLFDPAKLLAPLMPFIIALTVVSVLITVLYIISVVDKWRQGRAILETRDILREMNERDKARTSAVTTAPPVQSE